MQYDLDHTEDTAKKEVVKEQQANVRKRVRQSKNFREDRMWISPNTFRTLRTILENKLNNL
jgi:hypothetical protein